MSYPVRSIVALGLTLFFLCASCQPKEVTPLRKEHPTEPAVLPRDLAAHPWAQTEWWYYTGHLKDADGRDYGFELTFFRFRPDPEMVKSPLSKGVIGYMAHLAVVEEDAARYRNDMLAGIEGRLAGASPDRYRVFIGDWSVEGDEQSQHLKAKNREIGLDLMVAPDKPYVLHGRSGIVEKGNGLANYYFSNPRMKANGTLKLDGREFKVSGMAWFDHEYGYMGVTPTTGWDWFSLQLDDNTEYMFYRIRRHENGYEPESRACRIDAAGAEECVPISEIGMEVLSRWRSPKTGGVYPASWHIKIPQFGFDAIIVPTVPEQEFNHGLAYWEGSCRVVGQPANGRAFVELVGYARNNFHGSRKK